MLVTFFNRYVLDHVMYLIGYNYVTFAEVRAIKYVLLRLDDEEEL